jgi:hypothetical protein
VASLLINSSIEAGKPLVVYLCCGINPHREMVVHWHEEGDVDEGALELRPVGSQKWEQTKAHARRWSPARRTVLIAQLDQLEAGQRYECRIVGDDTVYTFRTVNDPSQHTVRFVVGGDMRSEWRPSRYREMCETVASLDPEFVVAAGDLAYCRGKPGAWPRWDQFLKEWQQLARSCRGDLIPIVPVIGNHEVDGGYGEDVTKAPHFYSLFGLPQQSPVRCMDLGKVCSLILLDSGHTHRCDGPQLQWLTQMLASRRRMPFRCAVYHVPGRVVSKEKGPVSNEVMQHWVPVFEREDMDCAFEHHLHTMKRSRPLKDGKPHPRGTVYFGAGCWGVPPREPLEGIKRDLFPYYEGRNGVWVIDLSSKRMLVRALDKQGEERDRVTLTPRMKYF